MPQSYEDLDEADLVILVGSNAAWCHPVLFQRMQANRERRGAKIVNIDPPPHRHERGRRPAASIKPGMDSVLFSWLLVQLQARCAVDYDFVETHATGFDEALFAARRIAPDIETVAAKKVFPPTTSRRFVRWYIIRDKVVTCYSQGVNQSAQGSDKVNAILNCHLASARIGRPSCGPLSLTGQPNAMGGREVGGLANMLAAHMGYSPSDVERVRRVLGCAAHGGRGRGSRRSRCSRPSRVARIKALWVMHTNPAVTLPRADAMRAALRKLDLFVVSEAMAGTDTTRAGAHVLLPAAAWGERRTAP